MTVTDSRGQVFTKSLSSITVKNYDVKPTADITPLSRDIDAYYAGMTTVSTTISNATSYYGGTIISSSLKIGNQAANGSGNGTLSIKLDSPGSFVPEVSVTDSHGQTMTERLDSIVVNSYREIGRAHV